jgi:hypothetical protein
MAKAKTGTNAPGSTFFSDGKLRYKARDNESNMHVLPRYEAQRTMAVINDLKPSKFKTEQKGTSGTSKGSPSITI